MKAHSDCHSNSSNIEAIFTARVVAFTNRDSEIATSELSALLQIVCFGILTIPALDWPIPIGAHKGSRSAVL